MEYPVIDTRTEEELLEEIGQKAKSYTPEWRFDRKNPDAGTALALMFAKLHHRTIGQFNRLLYKNQIDFYNRIGTAMRPCVPAEGFAAFSLVNGAVAGIHLEKGVGLTSDTDGEAGEKVGAETMDDVYVTPAGIRAVYECRKTPDYINCLYQSEEEQSVCEGFLLFAGKGENLTCHEWFFSHPSMFSFERTGRLGLVFSGPGGKPFPGEFLLKLADCSIAEFSYSAEEAFIPFGRQYEKDGILYLEKQASQPAAAIQEIRGISQYWVKMTLLDYSLCDQIEISSLKMVSEGPSMAPDYVQAEGTEQAKEFCVPFGEQFGVYSEVYFSCREALNKRGAWVSFSFQEGFMKVPIREQDRQETQWKLVMPKSSVAVSKEYDITIEEVIWEYFNGLGWARLFPGREYCDVFRAGEETEKKRHTLVFQCPKDMEPAYMGAAETYYIRARILKVNNAFKTEGYYVAPVLSQISFRYEYPFPGMEPEYFFCRSNLEERFVRAASCFEGLYPWKPFWQSDDEAAAVYVGLDRPFTEGPVRMLWVLKAMGQQKMPVLEWEYMGPGSRFKALNPADSTENFRQTGLVTFEGNPDWEPGTLFGRTLYWFRIRAVGNSYLGETAAETLQVEAVHMNAVRIRAVRSGFEEVFTMTRYEEHFTYRLLYQNIHRLELWVNEMETISAGDQEWLEKAGRIKKTRDAGGMVTEIWVKWEPKDGFSTSKPGDRHYILDANEGTITFGDNRNGRIPAVGVTEGVRVSYSIGGGAKTNLPPGGITGLLLAAGFINQATNPMGLAGGYDREDVSVAVQRRAGELRHRFRAVSLKDYEMLAMEASGGIARVQCISGYDEEGNRAAGHVSLLVLQEDYLHGGYFFPELKKRIMNYLEDKTDPNLLSGERLHIVKPVLVDVGVQCEITIRDYNESYEIRTELVKRLEKFLDPLKGGIGGKGWKIGELPDRSQIVTVIYQDERIRHMGNLLISCILSSASQKKEVSEEDLEKNPYLLTVGGTHRIVVRVE